MFYTAWVSSPLQKHLAVILFLIGLFSCDFLDRNIIAEVDGHKLYESDFEDYADALDLHPNDSLKEVFIVNWMKHHAVSQLLKKKSKKRYLTNKHRTQESLTSLNLFELENILIQDKLDTTITEDEITEYYERNRENYLTNSYIVKGLYIKIPDSIPEGKLLEEAFMLKKDKDLDIIEKYANIYSSNFYFEEKKWIFFEDLVRDVPLSEENKKELILSKGAKVFEDGNYKYLLNIFDYKLKETTAPLAFERERIKKHIIKRRINRLRNEVKNKLLSEIDEKYKIKFNY